MYLEINQTNEDIDKWVADNVVPHLIGGDNKVSETEAIEKIRTFVTENYGDEKPILVADVNQFDWNGLCELFGIFDIPFFYVPIDFSTILYSNGIDIDINRFELAKRYNIDVSGFNQHNALCDTRILKELWMKIK